MSRVAALMISLPILGCATAPHETTPQGTCDADAMTRSAIMARRAALLADMNRDVGLGKDGGVPGRSFDDRSTRNADAYVRRVEETWKADDRTLREDVHAIDRQIRNAACRAS